MGVALTSLLFGGEEWPWMDRLGELLALIWSLLTFSRLRRHLASLATADQFRWAAKSSTTYEQWHENQSKIDRLLGLEEWRQITVSRHYDWFNIAQQKREIERCQVHGDLLKLCGMLRMHPVRNLYHILSPKLYTTAYAGTKALIEDYIRQVQRCIGHLAAISGTQAAFNSQTKMELFHDTSHSFGRSTLVLQGGSAFSMCHVGVVKALHLRGLLPSIITGTAAGAFVAALVGVHLDHELADVLTSKGIDLAAFEIDQMRKRCLADPANKAIQWLQTLQRRVGRFLATGHLFDIGVLAECAKHNLGDITFEEAFAKTGRVLNVTVALPNEVGIPQLLNYVTAPHVLIRSAVIASMATSKTLYAPVQLYCKNETGYAEPYVPAEHPIYSQQRHRTPPSGRARLQEAPLKRIGELFNVNHFIVSQTRPYLIPVLRAEQNYPGRSTIFNTLVNIVSAEFFHALNQLNTLGWLPTSLCRLLIDETIPSSSRWAKISLAPELTIQDLPHLFETPTRHSLDQWILRGERSVWPAVSELRVRCGIEFELERAYENVKRRTTEKISIDFDG